MATEDAGAAIEQRDGVFYVDVINAVGERADEFDRIDTLPNQVARIEVEAELFAAADGVQGALGGIDVESDFRGMHFEREANTAFGEHIENWIPALGELGETVVNH